MPQPWLQTWLAAAAFYYPALWVSASAASAGPALCARIFARAHWRILRIGPAGTFAASWVESSGVTHSVRFIVFGGLLLGIVLILAAGIWRAGKNHRVLSGLFTATLADFALAELALYLRFARASKIGIAAEALVLFAVLTFGLAQMLAGRRARTYLARFRNLLAAYLPAPILFGVFHARRGPWHFWIFPAALSIPAVAAAMIASLFNRSAAEPMNAGKSGGVPGRSPHPGWAAVAVGSALSIAIYFGSAQAGRAVEQARRKRAQSTLAALPPAPAGEPYAKTFFQKGVNFSAEFPATYDSRAARKLLAELPHYGINSIALVPYGWTRSHGTEVFRSRGMGTWENDLGLEILTRVAHEHGMTVMLKPAVWRAFEIRIPQPAARAAWFRSYRRFILHYARLAARMHADIFCIGGEFVHLTQYSDEWRAIIASVRRVYPGPIVYAANFGKEFERITFWDHLDYIGLQEYYPLPADLSAQSLVAKVEAVQKTYRRPVIFTEVGFPSLEAANVRPWDDSGRRRVSLGLQARCYQAIFQTFYRQPWFEGMYWWNLETNGRGGPGDGS